MSRRSTLFVSLDELVSALAESETDEIETCDDALAELGGATHYRDFEYTRLDHWIDSGKPLEHVFAGFHDEDCLASATWEALFSLGSEPGPSFAVEWAVDTLPVRMRRAVRLRFGCNGVAREHTYQEIGVRLRVGLVRAREMVRKACGILSVRLRSAERGRPKAAEKARAR
jgi:hypothetical protein